MAAFSFMKRMTVVLLALTCFFSMGYAKNRAPRPVYTLAVSGGMTPAVVSLFRRGLADAVTHNAQALVLELNTTGGLVSATKEVVQQILASPIPVIAYVSPAGAHASTAGVFITYASHLAAMAPDTRLGVSSESSFRRREKVLPMSPARSVVLGDAASYLRALAALRHRNPDWATTAVFDAASLTAEQALQSNVVNVVAPNLRSLLDQIDGQSVSVRKGERILKTKQAALVSVQVGKWHRMNQVVGTPSVVYLLLMLGLLGILFELFHPGGVFPGVIGVLIFSAAIYTLHWLPTNSSALFLMALALFFFVLEALVMSYGILLIAGVVAFVLGSMMLFKQGPTSHLQVPLSLIITFTVIWVLACLTVFRMAVKVRRRAVVSGIEVMIGEEVEVHISGVMLWVRVQGERWQCESEEALADGQRVRIMRVDGLTLWVEPVDNDESL